MIQKLQDNRAVLLGAVAIFAFGLTTSGYALGDGLRRSKMAEHRTVTVMHGALTFVPDTPASDRVALANELSSVLHTLYAGAFIRQTAKGPTPAPDDAPIRRIETMFTPAARIALNQQAQVFRLGPHLDLLTGHVDYSGGMTRDRAQTTALLSVHFTGTGSRTNEGIVVVTVDQSGQLTLQRTAEGWSVRSFDLRITLKPPPPTPSPT